ncbi:MAG: glycosyltransferase, partial [Proteobacteria bacterium]|nr:glycosyltransferase [Pseudomonadota bacterium]
MPDPSAASLLQIAPNDYPPFLDICRCYHTAALSLGMTSRVVFLGVTTSRQDADFEYLNNPGFKDTARLVASLKREVSDHQGIVLCHRHRAYWVWLRSRLKAHKVVALAHEFGFFGRVGRRLAWWLLARDYLAGAVSDAVLAEHSRTTSRTLLLPNAIEIEIPLLDRNAACATLGLEPDRINIGLVGRLHPKKRPDLALRAFAVLASRLPDAHLVFIGDGELEGELRSAAVDQSVTFCGRVKDAATTFRALDVLLMTSTDEEAFGMVVLEAMRAGV